MTVQSVRKSIELFFLLGEKGCPVSLTEISLATEIPIATARRLLLTLVDSGLVRRVGKEYTLGVKTFEMGKKAEGTIDLIAIARPHLRELVDEMGENANLAVLDGSDVVYLACEECSSMVRAFTVTGARAPAYATGVGKVLLSGLSDDAFLALHRNKDFVRFTSRTVGSPAELLDHVREVRREDYAFDEGEREDGVFCVAAPIRDYEGAVVAAVSLSGPTSRLEPQRKEACGRTTGCAYRISTDLGWVPK